MARNLLTMKLTMGEKEKLIGLAAFVCENEEFILLNIPLMAKIADLKAYQIMGMETDLKLRISQCKVVLKRVDKDNPTLVSLPRDNIPWRNR